MSEDRNDSTFDREINLRGILITGAALAVLCIVASALMWWMLRGFERYDERRDVRPSPIEAANPQQPPPAPRLQVAPGFDVRNPKPIERSDREDMADERKREDEALSQPAWLDQGQGLVRVPIETAMQVIAARGVAPEVVGGHPGAAEATPPPPPAVPKESPKERRLQ
jgi:hypothetical protein